MASVLKTPKSSGSSTKKIEQPASSSTGRKAVAPGAPAPDGKPSVEPLLPQEKRHLSECPRGKCAECERIRKKTPSGRAKIQAQRDQASRAVKHQGPKRQPDGAYLYPPEEMTAGRYHYVAKMRPSDPLSRWFTQIGAFQRCDESVLQIDGTNTRLLDGRKMSTTTGRLAAAPGKWLADNGASPFWTGLIVEYFESRLPEVIERYRAAEARRQAERLRLLEEDLDGWGVLTDEAEIFLTLDEKAFLQETRAAARAKLEAARECSSLVTEPLVATCAERPAGYDAVYEFVGPLELDSDVPARENFDSWQPIRGDYLWNENDAEATGCRDWALAVAEQFALADEFHSHVDTSAAWRAARTLFRRARIVARTHILLDRVLQDVRLDRRADKAAYPFLTWFFRKWAAPPKPRPVSARLTGHYRDDLVKFVTNSLARQDCPKKDQYFWLMPILHRRWNWLKATGQHQRFDTERQFKVWYIAAAARSFDYKVALRSRAPARTGTTVTKRPKVVNVQPKASKEVVCICHDYVEKERKRMGGRIPSAAYDNVKRRYYALKAKCEACRRPRRSDRKNANRAKHASNGNIVRRGLIRLIRTDGWCYLRLFPAAEMLAVASYLGPYPLAGDVAYLLGTEVLGISSISATASPCFHVARGPRVSLPVRGFRPWWLTPVGGTPTMASLDAEVRRLRMLYEGAVTALAEAQAEVRALKAAPHKHCAIDFEFVDFEVTPPAPTEDCPPEMAECIRHASEYGRLHSFEDCREDCGHTHDDFVDREACRQNCHHVHDDFSDFAACTQHLMREGVRDLSNSYVAVSEEPVVLPVSTSSEQFSYLVPPSVQEPDDGSIPSGQMMLNELIRALNGKHVVPAKTEEYIQQQSGLYLYEARTLTEGSRNRAVEIKRVARLNIHVTRHDSLCLAPDAWVSGIRNAALAVLIKERFSGSHMPGIECSKTCPHHKGSPQEYPARKRRECRQFCGHEPLDFPEYVNLRAKHKALTEEVEILHKAGTTMEAEIARLVQEQQRLPRDLDWRSLPEVQDLMLSHQRELESLRATAAASSSRAPSPPAKLLPDLTSRVNATKASLSAWNRESFKGPRDQHSRRAMAHLSTCAVDALPTARLLPPPTRVFKPQILSRWWNNVNTAIEISGRTFSFHAAGRKFQYQDDTQLLTFDPASRAETRTKSWVANWNLLEYAYDRLKGREAQPEFLNALMISEDTLRHRARNARPYDMMTRRTYMKKWDRATTKPSDPGPWQDLADEYGYELDRTWTWLPDSYDAAHVHQRMTKRQFLALWPDAEILPPGTTVDLDYVVDGKQITYPVEFRLAPGLYLEPGPEVYVCHEIGFASWDRTFPCDMFMPHPCWAAAPLAPCMTPNFGGVFIPAGVPPMTAAPFAFDCVSRCMFGNFNNGAVKTATFRRFVKGRPTLCAHPTDRNIDGWCIECNAKHFPYVPERRCLTVPERWYFWALRHVDELMVAFNPEDKGIPHPYMIEDAPLFVSQPVHCPSQAYRSGPRFTKARWRIIGPVLAAHPDEPYGRDPTSRNLHQVSDACLMGWKTGGYHPRLLDCLNFVNDLELTGQVWVTAAMKPLDLVLPSVYTAVINFGIDTVRANVPVHACPVQGRLAATARLVTLASKHSGVLFSVRNGRGLGEDISAEELELIPIMYQLYPLFSLSWLSANIPVGAGTVHGTGGTIPWTLFAGAGKWALTYGYDELLLNELAIPTYMLKHRQDPYYGAYNVHFRPNIVGTLDAPTWDLARPLTEPEADTLRAVGKSIGRRWADLVEMRQDVADSRKAAARHEPCLLQNIRNRPWAPLAISHRSEELTCFRYAGAPGLHHTNFTPGRLTPPARLLHLIQRLRPLVNNKRVVVTASATSPPQRLRDVHINFGKPHPDWTNFPVPLVTGSGREYALWRLLPLFCEPKEVWIVNGRDLVEQPLPPLETGRFCSWNQHNCNPIILATTRTDVRLSNLDEFWHTMVYFGDTYGSDEWFLRNEPLTVYRPREHTAADWRTVPPEEEWPNVRIYERRVLVHDGPYGRVSRLANKPECPETGNRLGVWARPSLAAASGASAQPVRYLHAPTELSPQERAETVLIVCNGSRGDHVPLEYLARVIQTQGIKVALWSAHFLTEDGYQGLRRGHAGETLFAFLALMGSHHLGFRLVLTPGPKLHHRSCRYSLANWTNTEMPSWLGNPLAAAAARLLRATSQSLVIGCTPGTNTPRSADGLHRLVFHHPTTKRRPAAWVESSGSTGHIPKAIMEAHPGIRIPYDPSVFLEYERVYTTGTQGTVDTILAHGAMPIIVDAWFDQERTHQLTPAQFQENDFAALGHALSVAGFSHQLGSLSWKTAIAKILHKLSWSSGLKWLSLLVVLLQYVTVLAPWLATFPGLTTIAPAYVPLFWAVSKTLWNYPLLYYFWRWKWLVSILAAWIAFDQLTLWCLGAAAGTYMHVETSSKWPFFLHATIIDTRARRKIEYGWYGPRSLLAPFVGRVWNKLDQEESTGIRIPILIDFDAAASEATTNVGKYGPFFNCQSVWLTRLGNNYPVLTLFLLVQSYVVLLVFFPWAFVMAFYWLDIKFWGRHWAEQVTMGPRSEDHVNIVMGADFDEEEEPAITQSAHLEEEETDATPSEATAFEELSDEEQALAAIRFVISEMPEDEVVPDAFIKENATSLLRQVYDVSEDEVLREAYAPVQGDSLTAWVEDFTAWAFEEIRAGAASAPLVRDIVRFLLACKDSLYKTADPLLSALRAAFPALKALMLGAVDALIKLCSRLVDLVFGRQVTRKLKAAWFGAELLKANKLSLQQQVRENLAKAHFFMEADFDKQYAKDVGELRAAYRDADVDWDRLRKLQRDDFKEPSRYQHRGQRGFGGPIWKPLPLPRSLVLSQQELDVLMAEAQKEGVDFNARVDEFFTKRVDRLMAGGTQLATDGALLAAIRPRQAESSLLRYTYHGIDPNTALRANTQPLSPELKSRLHAVGDALYESCPEMFDNPRLTPPEAMTEWWKHRGMTKYNTTAPLNMASRAHAIADGQIAAIVRNVYEKEKAGEYPNQYYGAKVKQQAVPVKPLVTPNANGELKPVRTFTAQDSRSTAADWTVGLELKNRLPGDHVGVSSKMAAGQGYSPLFRKIMGKANIFEGDMGRYDSQLEAMHFEMIDRVLSRGCSDEVVLSWLTAKHQAMQNAYIAVLSLPREKPLADFLQHARASQPGSSRAATGYENWILKIRSGATGESSTNWTDTYTFRATFCLIVWDYCDHFGIPFHPKDFFNDALANLTNSGDDNMGHLDFLKKYDHVLDPQVMIACARKNNMILDFAVLDSFDKCEFLGCMARLPTQADLRTLDRVRSLLAAVNEAVPGRPRRLDLVKYAAINPTLVDPATLEEPDIIVYRNLSNSLVRQTATTLHGNVFRDDKYLEGWIAKYAGHIQLCAFRPTYHQDTMLEYIQTAARYLYAATPNPRRNQQGIVLMPEGEDYDRILALLNLQYEDVNKKMVYAAPLSKAPAGAFYTPELRRRLLKISQQPPAAYSKVIAIHMAYGKKPATYYERKMNKILSGLYPIDESAKEFLDIMRSAIGEASRKLVKGFQPQARDQMYLEDIYDTGHYYVESAIWTTWEEKVMEEESKLNQSESVHRPEMTLPIWQGLCSKAAFGSITDPLRFYALMQDADFNARVHEQPAYVYRNLMWCLVLFYAALWRLEVYLYKLPIIGFLYALFMFMVMDMSKIYGLVSMVYWLEYMDVHPVISSWMPRDPYVLAKRLSSWQLKLIPLWLAAVMPFALTGGAVGQFCVWFGQFFNRMQALKPLAGHGTPIDNPWTGDAHRMLDLLDDPKKTPDHAIVLNSETGTGKSALGTDALHRLIRHQVNPRSRTWVFVPTRILLKDPMPAFLGRGVDSSPEHEKTYQVLRRGVPIRANAEILFMTYGHGRNRLLAGDFQRGIDTAFVDEMHILSAEQRLVCDELHGERIIFSSATHVPPPGFVAPVFRSTQRKRWKAYQRVFPATTNVASMYQRARNDTEPVMGMRHSPAELSERALILCATFKEIDELMESLVTLRKSVYGAGIGVSLPPVVEVSSRVKPGTTEWAVRQAAFEKGSYIAVGTKQAATGMDIKPNPPWLLVDGGEDIYSHEGSVVRLPTTPRDHEQRIGRVTRNSSDRDGLVYCRQQAGSRDWDTLEYPSVSYCSEKLISDAYGLSLLMPVQKPALDAWPFFEIAEGYETHVHDALIFFVLASASGVQPRHLPDFYLRHWQHQIPLSDDYEWMDTILRRQGRLTTVCAPAWVTLEAVLAQKPIGWNTTSIRSPARREGSSLNWSNGLYPVAGEYLPFEEMARSSVRRIHKFNSKENTAENIAADIIDQQYSVIDRLLRQLQDEQLGRETPARKKVSSDEILRIEARERLKHAIRCRLRGTVIPEKPLALLATRVIESYQTRAKPPAGSYIGEDLTSSLDSDQGWGYCQDHGTSAVIAGTGPTSDNPVVLPCGCPTSEPGDHVIADQFVVVKRGDAWTSKYAILDKGVQLKRLLTSIGEKDLEDAVQYLMTEVTKEEKRMRKQKTKNKSKSDDRGPGRDVGSSRRHGLD